MNLLRRGPVRENAVLLLLLLVVALAACGDKAGSSVPPSAASVVATLQDQQGAQAEYVNTLARLDFPSGVSAPATIPSPAQRTNYEPGFGSALAERQWICAWERQWLATSGSAATKQAASDALARLVTAKETRFMSVQLDEAGRRLFDEYLTKAGLGDPSGVQQDVEQNCGA